jgi:hypothetical protein
MVIIFSGSLLKTEPHAAVWDFANEIVRKAVRHTFDSKKSVLYREIALNRIDVIPHVHPLKSPNLA